MRIFKKFQLVVSALLLCLILTACSTATPEETYSKITDYEPHEFVYCDSAADYGHVNIGVCKQLIGDVYTLIFFLDDDVSSWDDASREEFYQNRFHPSMGFLKDKAALHQIDLSLQFGQYTTRSEGGKPPRYNGVIEPTPDKIINNVDILSQLASTMGYPNTEVMHAFLKNATGVEQIAYIIVLNKAGRAYAVSDTLDDGKDTIEFVVAFAATEDGNADIGSTIIHETLHLFGATDLYDPQGKYPARKKLCKELYPNDVMMKSAADPETLSIGRLTEHLIGWSGYFPPECDCPEWWK